ncbi:deoxynucleoside kinase [Spirosoma sp. KUDC1026]|uniref:deoxynucleoside kinase n=1 Tax=Spirosoma sp. KUDC1026 TaxID=2745947 RepID=UPI00159B99E1|nr:deoxynucleoside kinase [Spirosoma sp. KUDC1026]QKZ13381.1 deoxynucleoside kinase [Spirosoma sp. KUDC1026]
MHIAITGNIGAGKTTLAELLAAHYGWEVLYEAVDGNPYLADFYDDMPRWAFQLQVYFLNSRFAQIRKIGQVRNENQANPNQQQTIIQDRTIYEDSAIFARNLHQNGQMSERDYQTYLGLFNNMLSLVRPPDLMVYLRADLPKLRDQIRKRGRPFEQAISDDYLLQLNRLYEEFIRTYQAGPVLILDVNTLDYAVRSTDFNQVVQRIDEQLATITH